MKKRQKYGKNEESTPSLVCRELNYINKDGK